MILEKNFLDMDEIKVILFEMSVMISKVYFFLENLSIW